MKKNRFMPSLSLADFKQAFEQSGLGDWHWPVQGVQAIDEPEGDVVLAPAKAELKPPPLYAVVLLNDDYTPMDFVIEILQQYFALSLDQATEVMLTVHYEGKGIAGVYPRDIAETKANQVNHYARSQGHPLLCMVEPKE